MRIQDPEFFWPWPDPQHYNYLSFFSSIFFKVIFWIYSVAFRIAYDDIFEKLDKKHDLFKLNRPRTTAQAIMCLLSWVPPPPYAFCLRRYSAPPLASPLCKNGPDHSVPNIIHFLFFWHHYVIWNANTAALNGQPSCFAGITSHDRYRTAPGSHAPYFPTSRVHSSPTDSLRCYSCLNWFFALIQLPLLIFCADTAALTDFLRWYGCPNWFFALIQLI